MGLSNKQLAFVNEYLRDFNATQAAIRAGYSKKTAYSIGQENLKKPEIADVIRAILDERSMGGDEIIVKLTEQARSDLGVFFKIIEEWTAYPLPSYDILGAEERKVDEETGETKVFYFVRHITIDLEKLVDPHYSHLVKKFSDSPKNGLGIELYDKQNALQLLAKIRGMFIEKTEITGKDSGPIEVTEMGLTDDERARRITALLERARARRTGQTSSDDGSGPELGAVVT